MVPVAPPVPAYLCYHHKGALMPPEFVGFIKGHRRRQPIIIYYYMPLNPSGNEYLPTALFKLWNKSESLHLYIQLVEAMRTVRE